VSHDLTDELRAKSVNKAKELFDLLDRQKWIGYHDILTGNESWFCQSHYSSSIWALSADEIPIRTRTTIQSEKVMLIVFLGLNAVAVKSWMERSNSLNSTYFKKHVLMPLGEKLRHSARIRRRSRTIIRIDNTRLHFSKANRELIDQNGFWVAPHSPYNPNSTFELMAIW
jgi:hypothetical protein